MKLQIVLLSGKKQVGKNTAAEVLIKNGYMACSFADSLKDMSAIITSYLTTTEIDKKQFEDINFKNSKIPHVFYTDKQYDTTYRKFLQVFGTELMRTYVHQDIWVHILAKRIITFYEDKIATKFVITDCRFPNEIDVFKQLISSKYPDASIKAIRIEREPMTLLKKINARFSDHISETALDFYKNFDATIHNYGSIAGLHSEILFHVNK